MYYVSEQIMRKATNVGREDLASLGTCFGKFTKTGKFRLQITCLDYLAQYAPYKVWLKPHAEQAFLYGHHPTKQGLGRITENTPQYVSPCCLWADVAACRHQGVVLFSLSDVPVCCAAMVLLLTLLSSASALQPIPLRSAEWSIQPPLLSTTKQTWASTCAMSKPRHWDNPDVNQLLHNFHMPSGRDTMARSDSAGVSNLEDTNSPSLSFWTRERRCLPGWC